MRKKIIALAVVNSLVLIYFSSTYFGNISTRDGDSSSSRSWYFHFDLNAGRSSYLKTPITSQFRGDSKKSGSYFVDLKRKINPVLKWTSDKINQAVHTASKSSPAVDDSGVYIGSDTGVMYAFDHAGKLRWSFKTDSDIRGIHGTALLDSQNLYFGNYSGFFYSLDKKEGKVNWISKVGNAVGSSAMLINEKLIISAEFDRVIEGHLVSLSPATGELIWKSEFLGEQIHSSPAYDEETNTVGVGSNNGVFRAIDVDSGLTAWKKDFFDPIKSTSAVIREAFCFSSWDKMLHCVDTLTGENKSEFDLGGRSQSSPAILGTNVLIVSSTEGFLYKINIDKEHETAKYNLKLGDDSNNYGMPSPIVIKTENEVLIVTSCNKTAICFLNSDLKLIKKIEIGGFVNGTFAVHENSIYGVALTTGLFRVEL